VISTLHNSNQCYCSYEVLRTYCCYLLMRQYGLLAVSKGISTWMWFKKTDNHVCWYGRRRKHLSRSEKRHGCELQHHQAEKVWTERKAYFRTSRHPLHVSRLPHFFSKLHTLHPWLRVSRLAIWGKQMMLWYICLISCLKITSENSQICLRNFLAQPLVLSLFAWMLRKKIKKWLHFNYPRFFFN